MGHFLELGKTIEHPCGSHGPGSDHQAFGDGQTLASQLQHLPLLRGVGWVESLRVNPGRAVEQGAPVGKSVEGVTTVVLAHATVSNPSKLHLRASDVEDGAVHAHTTGRGVSDNVLGRLIVLREDIQSQGLGAGRYKKRKQEERKTKNKTLRHLFWKRRKRRDTVRSQT